MPRGGRRPGAGAPKGNLNGLTTGNHSHRLVFVVGMLSTLPNNLKMEAARAAHKAGVWPNPRAKMVRGSPLFKRLVSYFYDYWIDRLADGSINLNQTNQTPEPTRTPTNQTSASPVEIPANSKDNQTHA